LTIDLGPGGSIGGWPLGQRPDIDVRDLLELRGRPRWMRDAACREHPEVNWHPDVGQKTEPAKAICRGCLVRAECLEHALEHREPHGIWGGQSPKERRAIARLRRAS
jgi:WhiB family redox-sensing transcriptional regulator